MEKEELALHIAENQSAMLRLALSMLRCGADAEDAVADAIVAALDARNSLKNDASVKSWLMTITARCCQDQLRRRKREQPAALPEEASCVFQEDLTGTLYALVQQLSPGLAQVMTLYYFDGYDAREIAQILHLPQTAVFMRLSRGRKQLRALVQAEGGLDL